MKTRLDFVSNSSSSSYIIAVEDNPHMMVLNDPQLLTFKELVDKFSNRLFGPSNFYRHISDAPIIEICDEEFLHRFMNDTVFDSCDDEDGNKTKIYMPHDALYPYTISNILQKERNTVKWDVIRKLLNGNTFPDSKEYESLSEFYVRLLQASDDAVAQACYSALEPYLKDMRFCYQEISDNYRGYCINGENPFDMSIDPDTPASNRKHEESDPEEVMTNRKYQTFYEPLDQPHDECLVEARIAFLEKLNGPLKFKRIFSNH